MVRDNDAFNPAPVYRRFAAALGARILGLCMLIHNPIQGILAVFMLLIGIAASSLALISVMMNKERSLWSFGYISWVMQVSLVLPARPLTYFKLIASGIDSHLFNETNGSQAIPLKSLHDLSSGSLRHKAM